MAFPKFLFHAPQQNSSNDTMTGSFQISNTVNRLLTPPPGGLFISITFEGGGGLFGGGGGGLLGGGGGAYLIYRTWWYQVSIRTRMQSGKAQVQDVRSHAAGHQKQIRTSNT